MSFFLFFTQEKNMPVSVVGTLPNGAEETDRAVVFHTKYGTPYTGIYMEIDKSQPVRYVGDSQRGYHRRSYLNRNYELRGLKMYIYAQVNIYAADTAGNQLADQLLETRKVHFEDAYISTRHYLEVDTLNHTRVVAHWMIDPCFRLEEFLTISIPYINVDRTIFRSYGASDPTNAWGQTITTNDNNVFIGV